MSLVTLPTPLSNYVIISGANPGITNSGTLTTITNGNLGAANASYITLSNYTLSNGTIDTTNNGTALTQALALITTINALPSTSIGTTISTNVTYTPGAWKSASAITFGPNITITLDANNNPNAQFFIIAQSAITFTGPVTINLINGASNCNVFWVAVTAAITFSAPQPIAIAGIFLAGTAISLAGSQPSSNSTKFYGKLFAQSQVSFAGTGSYIIDGTCGVAIDNGSVIPVVCYAKGSKILTKNGFKKIEDLKLKDQIATKGKILFNNKNYEYTLRDDNLKLEPLMWISKFKVHKITKNSAPICIKKDALGENYPFEDLYVSPAHGILLNGKMVQAKKLVNGKTISQDLECEDVEYYHVELSSHSAIIANGILAESYLDVNNRDAFEPSKKLQVKKFLNRMNLQR